MFKILLSILMLSALIPSTFAGQIGDGLCAGEGTYEICFSSAGVIRPTTDNVAYLGNSTYRFKDIYAKGSVYLGAGVNITTITAGTINLAHGLALSTLSVTGQTLIGSGINISTFNADTAAGTLALARGISASTGVFTTIQSTTVITIAVATTAIYAQLLSDTGTLKYNDSTFSSATTSKFSNVAVDTTSIYSQLLTDTGTLKFNDSTFVTSTTDKFSNVAVATTSLGPSILSSSNVFTGTNTFTGQLVLGMGANIVQINLSTEVGSIVATRGISASTAVIGGANVVTEASSSTLTGTIVTRGITSKLKPGDAYAISISSNNDGFLWGVDNSGKLSNVTGPKGEFDVNNLLVVKNPSVGISTGSPQFTLDVNGSAGALQLSATYGVSASTLVITNAAVFRGTATVEGANFSVAASTLSVTGGTVIIAPMAKADIATRVGVAGGLITCSDCLNDGLLPTGPYSLCVGTGTGVGAFVYVSSPTLACY